MEESCQEVVDLVTIAAQLTEEAKKAEAHARASKAYARKVTKESHNASTASGKLLHLSGDLLREYIIKLGIDHSSLTANSLQRELHLLRYRVKPEQVKGLLEMSSDNHDLSPSSELSECLKLDDHQMKCAVDLMERDEMSGQNTEDIQVEESCENLESWHERPATVDSLTVRFSGSMMLQAPAVNVGTKRRSRKRKTTAMSATSPLISENDILIYRRSTSPSPSVTSQGYYVPVQHKFTVQRNRSTSTTSQKTLRSLTDDEAPSGSDKEDINFQ